MSNRSTQLVSSCSRPSPRAAVRGANFVEYLVLVGVLALAGIGIFQTFGQKVDTATKKQGDAVIAIPTNH